MIAFKMNPQARPRPLLYLRLPLPLRSPGPGVREARSAGHRRTLLTVREMPVFSPE